MQASNRTTTKNLFSQVPAQLADEFIDTILDTNSIRIQRIISAGHSSPPGYWYDQDTSEWVVVLKGEGTLLFADDEQRVHMKAGDYINIPAHKRHRVEWTTPDEPTLWLAIHYD